MYCESALAGQYATLACGLAKPTGEVEIHNVGHWTAIMVGSGSPLGMFHEVDFSAARPHMEIGDKLQLHATELDQTTCPPMP